MLLAIRVAPFKKLLITNPSRKVNLQWQRILRIAKDIRGEAFFKNPLNA